ncbi:MAG: hypothetical protein IPG61_09120 [bacterium]|nr:hypothetical protein [bacterium]
MKFLAVATLLLAGAGWAGELELRLSLESQTVPVDGAVCGVVTFANSSDRTSDIAVPSMNLGNLYFEVDQDGRIRKIGSPRGAMAKPGVKVSIDSGAKVSLPFYLLRNGEHWFADSGQFSIRAVFSDRNAQVGPAEPLRSPWVRFDVVDNPLREIWRAKCQHQPSVYFPFDFLIDEEMTDELRHSEYFRTFALYQGFNSAVLTYPEGRPIVRERMVAIESQLKTSVEGRAMWEHFRDGKCIGNRTGSITGDVYAVWR